MLYIIIIIVLISILFVKTHLKRITIFEYEKGLKYSKGEFKQILSAGQYWIFSYYTTIKKVDIRLRFISITGQEVLSSDGVTLKVSIATQYEIAEPDIAINKIENYQEALYLILQLSLREIIGNTKVDELIENRNIVGDKLMELSSGKSKELGLKLLSANIKDIMFPGELKKIFAQVIKAQKEGLAALEKARGESAALRNLANAAKMIENNPNLMQLRVLQHLGESSGNTLILGIPPTSIPIPLKSKETDNIQIGELNAPESDNEK